MKRLMCLDYGEKRIGVAISDPLGLTAQTYPYISNDEKTYANIQALIKEKNIQEIILGLPKNQKGEEGPQALKVRGFGEALAKEVGLPIQYSDERFSTVAVTKHLIAADVSRKKRKEIVDSQAAAYILQGVLDAGG